jgi:hypothetical protein
VEKKLFSISTSLPHEEISKFFCLQLSMNEGSGKRREKEERGTVGERGQSKKIGRIGERGEELEGEDRKRSGRGDSTGKRDGRRGRRKREGRKEKTEIEGQTKEVPRITNIESHQSTIIISSTNINRH